MNWAVYDSGGKMFFLRLSVETRRSSVCSGMSLRAQRSMRSTLHKSTIWMQSNSTVLVYSGVLVCIRAVGRFDWASVGFGEPPPVQPTASSFFSVPPQNDNNTHVNKLVWPLAEIYAWADCWCWLTASIKRALLASFQIFPLLSTFFFHTLSVTVARFKSWAVCRHYGHLAFILKGAVCQNKQKLHLINEFEAFLSFLWAWDSTRGDVNFQMV